MTLYFVEVGLVLLIAPWTVYWERNIFVEMYPALEPYLLVQTVRGAVSGLGLINLFAAVTEFGSIVRPSDTAW
ncbi:hypothetical protein EVA25_01910 [bacterium]|nr:MAG: hypothetical protein EVA25_01910 [bacterium]